jgi:hypothetical protein
MTQIYIKERVQETREPPRVDLSRYELLIKELRLELESWRKRYQEISAA